MLTIKKNRQTFLNGWLKLFLTDSYPLQDGSARKQPFPINVQLESIREIKLIDFFNGFLMDFVLKHFLVKFQ